MKLAIHGGAPVRSSPFFAWPYYDENERFALMRALDQGQWWRMSGGENLAFEEEFATFHGAHSSLAVTNGTHALEIALLVSGVRQGDEVIIPAFTYIATASAVQAVGAVPIPVDIDMHTFCIDPAQIKQRLSPRTRAIIPVHMAGHPADMNALCQLASQYNLTVIQDAAHAHGMCYQGKRVGEWKSIACFSFQNFKLMTAGEGGALTFQDEEMRARAFLYHNGGRAQNDRSYQHQVRGSNFRLGEFAASVLREQLSRLPLQNQIREKNAVRLYRQLSEIEGILTQQRAAGIDMHSHYMVLFRLDHKQLPHLERDAVVQALVAEGIPAYRAYSPVYRTTSFWETPETATGTESQWAELCSNTELLASEGIWIHHRVLLGDDRDVDDVAAAISKVVKLLGKHDS
jgi:3-amino-5-hydroxybenzoate synthase